MTGIENASGDHAYTGEPVHEEIARSVIVGNINDAFTELPLELKIAALGSIGFNAFQYTKDLFDKEDDLRIEVFGKDILMDTVAYKSFFARTGSAFEKENERQSDLAHKEIETLDGGFDNA